MQNGEQNLKLNFPYDYTEVFAEEKKRTSKYFGVTSKYGIMKWYAQRHSKKENKMIFNGSYDNEETAAHASDTLARKLMSNGNRNLRLNFPDDDTEVWSKARITSEYQPKIEYENKKRKKPKN